MLYRLALQKVLLLLKVYSWYRRAMYTFRIKREGEKFGEAHVSDCRRPAVKKRESRRVTEERQKDVERERVTERMRERERREGSKTSPLSVFTACILYTSLPERWKDEEREAANAASQTKISSLSRFLSLFSLLPSHCTVFLQWCWRMIESSPTDSIFKQMHQ